MINNNKWKFTLEIISKQGVDIKLELFNILYNSYMPKKILVDENKETTIYIEEHPSARQSSR